MNNVFTPSTPFDIWLYGFKCYDKRLRERGTITRRVFFALWQSLCTPSDVCSRCAGCDSGLDSVILDYPFKGIPDEKQVSSYFRIDSNINQTTSEVK